MSASESTEFDILESILPRFKAEGFEVFVHPSPSILPPFMHAYRPDAIALSRDKKIAIEVVRQSANSETKIKDLQDLIAQHSDWELRVFYVSAGASQQALEIASRSSIDTAIQKVLELKKNDHSYQRLSSRGRLLRRSDGRYSLKNSGGHKPRDDS
jgi:REase_AHJR-like protein